MLNNKGGKLSHPVIGRWIAQVKVAVAHDDISHGTAVLNQMRAYFGKPGYVINAFSGADQEVLDFVNNWALSPEVAGVTFD